MITNNKYKANINIKKMFYSTQVNVNTGEGSLLLEVNIDPLVIVLGFIIKFLFYKTLIIKK